MTDATVQLDGKTVIINFGENTNVAAAAALRAESAAIAAQAAAGVGEYANTAAGLAGTAEGEFFWVDNGAGIGIVYRHDAGPVATEIRRFIIDPEGTSAASLIGADDGASGTLWTKVQGFIDYLMSSAGSAIVGFIQSGTGAVARTAQAKMREKVSIADFGADPGEDIVATVGTALTALGTTNNATLVFPKGSYTIGQNVDWSAYRNVTFVLEPGCSFGHSTFNIVFPERVDAGLGVTFTGSGTVTVKNKDEVPLATPPADYVRTGNDASGVGALENNVGGFNNFAWGYRALGSLEYGRSNIAIGTDALADLVGVNSAAAAFGTPNGRQDANTAIGERTLANLNSNSADGGYENTAIGFYNMLRAENYRWGVCVGGQSQLLITSGEANVTLGWYNLTKQTGASSNNLAIGFAALEEQTSGSNVAIGHVCMNANDTGTRNVAVGPLALQLSTHGDDNTVMGLETAKNVSGTFNKNIAIGNFAIGQGTTGTIEQSVAIGYSSMLATTASVNNVGVGNNTLLAMTTGTSNTGVGAAANNAITTQSNCQAFGFNAQCTASNQVTLGDGNITTLRCAVTTITAISDARHKKNIAPLDIPDEFLDEVEIVTFNWLSEEMTPDTQVGVIAQQLDELQTRYGLEWLGLVDKTVPDRWEATPGKLLFLMVQKLQRMTKRTNDIESRLAALESSS